MTSPTRVNGKAACGEGRAHPHHVFSPSPGDYRSCEGIWPHRSRRAFASSLLFSFALVMAGVMIGTGLAVGGAPHTGVWVASLVFIVISVCMAYLLDRS